MCRVIIAEYEENIIKEIMMILEEYKEIEVVGVVSSGKEGVELTKEKLPDMIITAVRIMGINGLEMIKQIRKFNSEVNIIIVSLYDYFDFAKRAIELKVNAYLLKPINKGELREKIEQILKNINVRKEIKEECEKAKSRIIDTQEYAEKAFIYDTLFNTCGKEEIETYVENLNIAKQGYVINIEFMELESLHAEKKFVNRSFRLLYKYVKESLETLGNCIVGSKIGKRLVIYVPVKNIKINVQKRKNDVYLAIDNLMLLLKEKMDINIRVGVGEINDIYSIHRSYEEALRCLRYNIHRRLVFLEDIEEHRLDVIELKNTEIVLIEYIRLGKSEAIDVFISIIESLHDLDNDYRKSKIIELFIRISYASNLGRNEKDGIPMNHMEYYNEIKDVKEDDIDTWACKKFRYIMKCICMDNFAKMSTEVRMALEYMTEHYNEELSLEEVSKYVGLSPQYFSKLFKEESGSNYVDWIASIRVDKAKELLKNSTLNIREIGFKVGYNDPNYFSRIFKKITGNTPKQYIAKNTELEYDDNEN